jgi:glycosyltransferase involved in cell wall biosynthesis
MRARARTTPRPSFKPYRASFPKTGPPFSGRVMIAFIGRVDLFRAPERKTASNFYWRMQPIVEMTAESRNAHRIAYVANQFPLGTSETFIWPEVDAHRDAGFEIVFCPISKGRSFHKSEIENDPRLLAEPLLSLRVLVSAIATAIAKPRLVWALAKIAVTGRARVILRNVAVLPKGLWLGRKLKQMGVSHIHAHWLSAPATAAMYASKLSGIPYSITAHRIDISQANLISEKLRTASFIRAIDSRGLEEIRSHDRSLSDKACLIYLGTHLPSKQAPTPPEPLGELRMVTAARLVEKKGHTHLIEAMAMAAREGVSLQLDLIGDGPLQKALMAQAEKAGLSKSVRFLGTLPHSRILDALQKGDYQAAVLPSITAQDGDREGIPAFLMEAMAAGVPVISTDNGGISELVTSGTGLLVQERDLRGLADAMVHLARTPGLRAALGREARSRIATTFNVFQCAQQLRTMMQTQSISERDVCPSSR